MKYYRTKKTKLPGTNYSEIRKNTLSIFNKIKKKTKRKPYLRSDYFKKEKIFFDFFWTHLFQKNPQQRVKRLKYFAAALEVIEKSRITPVSIQNPHKNSEILHRFIGSTKEGDLFYVQIKENKISKRKYFMSCFPLE